MQNRTIARDSAGNVWVAWYDLDHGVVMRQLDPTTGVPVGSPAIAPTSNYIYNGGSRIALVCNPVAPGCRGRISHRGQPSRRHLGSRRVRADDGRDDREERHARAAACRVSPDGRLWVGWVVRPGVGDPTVQFTLGDVRGAGGTSYPVGSRSSTPPTTCGCSPSATSCC